MAPQRVQHRVCSCLLLVFNVADDGRPEIYTRRTNLKRGRSLLYRPPVILRNTKDRSRSIRISATYHTEEHEQEGLSRPLYFVHACCWKAVRQQCPLSLSGLYRFARQTQPILPRDGLGVSTPQLPVQFPHEGTLVGKTELAGLLSRAGTYLPAELQREVLRYLCGRDKSYISSLIQATHTTALVRLVDQEAPRIEELGSLLHEGGEPRWLGASTISLFDQFYLHRIALVHREDDPNLDLCILVQVDAVAGVKFVLGTHGLQALRIIYRDGSSSPWLGKPSRSCYGAIYGSSLRQLRVLYDACCSPR